MKVGFEVFSKKESSRQSKVSETGRTPVVNLALTDDLHRRLREEVETGKYPNEEAVMKQASARFLVQESPRGGRQVYAGSAVVDARVPGPFLEDHAMSAPADLPRRGEEITVSPLHGSARMPILFPGE